ncbi:hypothetical protein [Marinifilum caeruleilacunae]|uniref:Uncharacterized protein n=1 Tax=Marinifilum caeruleilacunae TaxID=2499076 RepID=A0ABX1WYB6_9BACT|nr:hypothetical protein [Marinifilum caeruleilacunae]NOU61059.1 hypothetical protein [Marinifilum caeruleilacunae]
MNKVVFIILTVLPFIFINVFADIIPVSNMLYFIVPYLLIVLTIRMIHLKMSIADYFKIFIPFYGIKYLKNLYLD